MQCTLIVSVSRVTTRRDLIRGILRVRQSERGAIQIQIEMREINSDEKMKTERDRIECSETEM